MAGHRPVRVPQGWLLLYHGVSGTMSSNPFEPQKSTVHYAAGGLLLAADDPSRVIARTTSPCSTPRPRTSGSASWPTWSSPPRSSRSRPCSTFYGMADEAIGVARIERVD